MWGKHLNCAKLQAHIAKLRKRNPKWQLVGSQAVQDICQRIEKGYQLFFKHNKKGVKPPSFKKVKKYKSFTLKQAGYKLLGGNKVKIGSRVYQYWNSREISGTVKALTIKRTRLGELFMVVVIDAAREISGQSICPETLSAIPEVASGFGPWTQRDVAKPEIKFETSKIAGFDFGLHTFLTCSDGSIIESP